jgi:hypothetical protein
MTPADVDTLGGCIILGCAIIGLAILINGFLTDIQRYLTFKAVLKALGALEIHLTKTDKTNDA